MPKLATAPDRGKSNTEATPRPLVKLVHASSSGRVRFAVAGLKRHPLLAQDLLGRGQRLSRDVHLVAASPVTGTVLLMLEGGPARLSEQTVAVQACLEELVAHLHLRFKQQGSRSGKTTGRLTDGAAAQPWYFRSVREAVASLETSVESGLTLAEAERRFQRDGANGFEVAPKQSPWLRLGRQLNNLPTALLSVSAALSLALRQRVDAALVGSVALANAAIGYAMEAQSERVIDSMNLAAADRVAVLRGGRLWPLAPSELVVGDLVPVQAGPVAADLRLVQATQLSVDESALTGESQPVLKQCDALSPGATVRLAERSNMLFQGTVVIGGSGLGIVVAAGVRTEVGRVHQLTCTVRPPATPLQRRLDELSVTLVYLSAGICGCIMLLGIARGLGALRMLKSAVSLAVAALPEGLPTVATLTLALGVQRLKERQVLVRRLSAVENLGATSELCFDKTGTITYNRLEVAELSDSRNPFQLRAKDQVFSGRRQVAAATCRDLQRLITVALLCNDAAGRLGTLAPYDESSGPLSMTEEALLGLSSLATVSLAALAAAYPRLDVHYRSDTARYMATLHQDAAAGGLFLAVKGSPEEVLSHCAMSEQNGRQVLLSPRRRQQILHRNAQFAGRALRVLGFAYRRPLAGDTAADHDLIWLGLIGLKDQLRPGVKAMLAQFHRAGIRTSMITGDQERTAQALCRELGVGDGQDQERGPGEASEQPQFHVYARVTPAGKLQIVQDLQARGRVVAMTGDGINDSPALRAADVGIAMGSGAQVARDVAEVVLADNQLGTLFDAVLQGRSIRDNLGKSLHFLLATNLSEILVLLGSVALGRADQLSPRQLLWINLLTDVLPALGLAVEPPEPDVMQRPPRAPNGRLFTQAEWRGIVWEAGLMALASLAAGGFGPVPAASVTSRSTRSFFALTLAQLLHTQSSRSRLSYGAARRQGNDLLTAGIAGGLGLQLATLLLPNLRRLLGNARLGLGATLRAGMFGVLPFVVIEWAKALHPSWLHNAVEV